MNFKLERTLVIIGAIIIIALAMGLPFLFQPSQDLLPNFALSQLTVSAVAFFIIFLTLYFTIIQLRKSMAKPKIKIYFSENKATAISVKIAKSVDLPVMSLELWIVNSGNAVAKSFQVELDVPDDFNPNFHLIYSGVKTVPPRYLRDVNIRTVSFCNIENYCFVGLPTHLVSLTLEIHKELYNKYPDEFKVPYRVYGDWAETQEGKLRVICKKEQEVS